MLHCSVLEILVAKYCPKLATETDFHQHVDVLLVLERFVQPVTTHATYSLTIGTSVLTLGRQSGMARLQTNHDSHISRHLAHP